jgi:GT2 family glycosyltransferase
MSFKTKRTDARKVCRMLETSIIVVNWNGKHFLETCLTALRQQTFQGFETILVDNGSTDGSVEYVRTEFPEVKLTVLHENRGFTGGNITGYELAHGDLIVLLNNDTEAHPRWLEEIHNAVREHPNAGSFASKMLLFDERKRIDICGSVLTTAGTTVPLGRGELDGPAWIEPCKVFGACAGAAAYRRSMIEDVGFFDPDLFMVYEDLDLSFRAQLRGYECMFVPGAIVYHHLGATRNKTPARNVFFSQRNVELAYLKNMPLWLMLLGAPQRLLYELGSAAYFFKLGTGLAFLKAKLDVVRCLPAVVRKRREIQRRRTLTNAQLRAMMQSNWLGLKWKKLISAWRGPSAALRARRSSS